MLEAVHEGFIEPFVYFTFEHPSHTKDRLFTRRPVVFGLFTLGSCKRQGEQEGKSGAYFEMFEHRRELVLEIST